MILALALLGSALGAPVTLDVESRGRVRTVDLHEPDGAARGAVILLHGAGGDRTFAQRTGLDVAAPAAGLALAVPDGTGFFRQSWRASPGCCGEAALWDSDDTLFLDALAVSLRERLDVDRIVVAGFCGQAHTLTHGSDVCILGAATQRRARRWVSVRAPGRCALVAGLALGEAGISAPDAEERVFRTPVAV